MPSYAVLDALPLTKIYTLFHSVAHTRSPRNLLSHSIPRMESVALRMAIFFAIPTAQSTLVPAVLHMVSLSFMVREAV